ncbi:NACHT, LRR and PYD domains-containing protein 3-like [Ornithorhynchus anatinus]|uniref:NACHT, LRR and PYD domains-containing protein 3-like n=1 Tax=Ornithorhynchus anatinus TaxID=9258 RepID=UPI0010A85D0D|nr:NACHT, LRR and PYD domains-containing protein 3-like [Ornithorhynchus anatinus]
MQLDFMEGKKSLRIRARLWDNALFLAIAAQQFRLILGKCCLTSACCQSLSSTLANNQNLKHLDLSYSDLGDIGAKWLFEVLRHPNCSLESMMLVSCHLTDTCYEDLSSILTCNQKLTCLNLFENDLSELVKQQL